MHCDHQAAVTEIFAAFDTPTGFADATGIAMTTVFDWRAKGKPEIPPWRRPAVLAAVQKLNKKLSANAIAYLASADRAPREARAA